MDFEIKIKKTKGDFTLDLDIASDAKRIGIAGPSGAGKSLTLRCIAGVEKPDSGRLVLNGKMLFDPGERIDLPPGRRRIGYMFQHYALFPTMTVEQNIMAGIKGDRKEAQAAAARLMEKVELLEHKDKYPSQLSGGQQQRTALARILATDPEMILLDEPFSALDAHLKQRIQAELEDMLADFQGQIVMVSHDREEINRFAEEVIVLDRGIVKEIEKTESGTGSAFTHFDGDGNAVMVDVSGKRVTRRTAVAEGEIRVSEEVMEAVLGGQVGKGDVLTVSQIAGIMGSKQTASLIPLCHPIPVENVEVTFDLSERGIIRARSQVTSTWVTGVEMEALTAVSTALLTIYDMCKAIDKRMVIGDIHLVSKTGGKSGEFFF